MNSLSPISNREACVAGKSGRAFLICLNLVMVFLLANAAIAQEKPKKAEETQKSKKAQETQKPTAITFKLSKPSLAPGEKITITALDENGRVIESGVNWTIPKGFESVIERTGDVKKTKELTVIGLNPPAGQSKLTSNLVPIIAQTDDITTVVNVPLLALPVARGPLPPGLDPEVDIMWSVLPSDIVGHSFGRAIKKSYYGIEVVIGNNTGYDLQIASVGFELPEEYQIQNRIPSTGFRVARGTADRARALYPRNIILNTIRALGPVLTGFTPFFHNLNRRGNFTEGVNILSNPLEKGFDLVVPDLSIEELNRLQDMLLRDDITTRTVIPNNTQVRTLVFIPRRSLRDRLEEKFPQGTEGYEKKREDPLEVMKALGNLVLKGDRVDYLNRVRVVAAPDEGRNYSISGKVRDCENSPLEGVTVRLMGGDRRFSEKTATTDANGNFAFNDIPSGAKYVVIPSQDEMKFAPEASSRDPRGGDNQSFVLDQSFTNVDFRTRKDTYTISGSVNGVAKEKADEITVKITKKGDDTAIPVEFDKEKMTFTATSVAAGEEYVISLESETFTAEEETVTLNCDIKGVILAAEKKEDEEN